MFLTSMVLTAIRMLL